MLVGGREEGGNGEREGNGGRGQVAGSDFHHTGRVQDSTLKTRRTHSLPHHKRMRTVRSPGPDASDAVRKYACATQDATEMEIERPGDGAGL